MDDKGGSGADEIVKCQCQFGHQPACRDRPRVCPHPSDKDGINTQSLGPFDQYIASVRRTEVRRTDTGSVPTCGLSAEREFLFTEMGVFAARKSCGF